MTKGAFVPWQLSESHPLAVPVLRDKQDVRQECGFDFSNVAAESFIALFEAVDGVDAKPGLLGKGLG
jgi:hypothetical protein